MERIILKEILCSTLYDMRSTNMLNIIGIFYLIIFFSFALAALFIIFHIVKYSINKTSSFFMLAVFIPIFSVLLISNLVLFFSVRWDQIFDFVNLGSGGF